MTANNCRRAAWRAALLAGVSSVAISHGSGALAACSGVDTGTVLCDAANPSGGSLTTIFAGSTTVTVNAGAGITGTANAAVTVGDLTFNHSDPGGIGNPAVLGLALSSSGTGNITYTGSANVTGPHALSAITVGGTISIRQSGGVVAGEVDAVSQSGSILIDTTGSQVISPAFGIFAQTAGPQADISIHTGAVTTAPGQSAIFVRTAPATSGGRNFGVTTDGAIIGTIEIYNNGLGTTGLTARETVNGAIDIRATNTANTSAVTVTLDRDVNGGVTVRNAGTGSTNVHTHGITGGRLEASGTGANNSLVVDGNVAMGTQIAFGGSVALVSLTGSGTQTATINGAISGNFDSSSLGFSTFKYGLTALLGSTSANGAATLNVTGPVTITGTAAPGSSEFVMGVVANSSGIASASFNIGAVSATNNGAISPGATGVTTAMQTFGNHGLTANGAISATANGSGGTANGINAITVLSAPGASSATGEFTILAASDVTATADGAASGIIARRGAVTVAGLGGVSVTSQGTVTATSANGVAIGVTGEIANGATNAATLSIRTEGDVIASGLAAGSIGIRAQRDGLGDIRIDALAKVQSSGIGISASRTTAGNILITTGANTEITGTTGVVTSGGTTTLVNAGTITGTGGTAIQFGGTNDVLTLLAGSSINGNVLGNGSSVLQLGSATAATFDTAKLGAGFANFNILAGANWTLTGSSAFAGTVNVDGLLSVNAAMTGANVIVGAGGTLGGTGSIGNTTISGTLSPGNSPGTITMASLTLTTAASYLVQVSGTISDSVVVTGTANVAGTVVIDPLTRLTQRTTYTIVSAGTLNGTFSTANLLTANNFARNPVLSYVGNDVLLTLDPGLLSPVLPANAGANQNKIAGAIDNGLLGGGNLSNAFSAIFNLSGNNLLNGLTQLSGETATGSQQTTFHAMTQFMGLMTDPFIDGTRRMAPTRRHMPGKKIPLTMPMPREAKPRSKNEREAYAAVYSKAPLARNYDPRWSVWGAGFGGSQTTDGNVAAGSNNTTSRVFGVAAGADYRFSPNTIAGFALAGGGTNFSVTGGGSGRSDLFQAGAFVKHNIGAAYISGALAYGWQDITTDRTVTVGTVDRLRAQFNANAFSGRAEGGYRFVAPWIGGIGITPYAAGQFTTFDLPAYAEQVVSGANTFALAYGSKSVTATRSEVGLRADKSFAMTNAILTLRGRAAWAHDFNPDRTVAATFQTLPGAIFVVNGARQASNAALTTAAAEIKWMNGWSVGRHVRGRILRRHPQLCRQGRGPLRLVNQRSGKPAR